MNKINEPLVSIVTPFYNGEQYLALCIDGVLAQTYGNWEYILVNNCSTDQSPVIAESYARRESRIRVVHNQTFLNQVQNYNHALEIISPYSKYCKIAQADDFIFPACIAEMVMVAEKYPTVGIVSSYRLRDKELDGDGLPYSVNFMTGADICKWHLLNHPEKYIFGTPNTLLFRSDLVRSRSPFYDEESQLEDYEVCYDLLKNNDFGFVHQVLTFERVEEESISAKIVNFYPYYIHAFLCMKKYGPEYLTAAEYHERLLVIQQRYFRALAKGFLYEENNNFWTYHQEGLKSIGLQLNDLNWSRHVFWELLDICRKPRTAISRISKILKKSQNRIAGLLKPAKSYGASTS